MLQSTTSTNEWPDGTDLLKVYSQLYTEGCAVALHSLLYMLLVWNVVTIYCESCIYCWPWQTFKAHHLIWYIYVYIYICTQANRALGIELQHISTSSNGPFAICSTNKIYGASMPYRHRLCVVRTLMRIAAEISSKAFDGNISISEVWGRGSISKSLSMFSLQHCSFEYICALTSQTKTDSWVRGELYIYIWL